MMDNNKPLVSVIVPVYNSERFVEECIKSLTCQDYDNLEILISDDCSTDNTCEIISKFEEDEKVKIFYQEKNLGITDNCNFLIGASKGKYICFFAGDDIMLPRKISKQVNFMEENNDCSFSYHPAKIYSTEDNKILTITDKNCSRPITNVNLLIEEMGIPASMSIMARKDALPKNGFNKKYKFVSDWLMQIEMSLKGEIGFINEPLCIYRKYGDNNGKNISSYEHEFTELLKELSHNYPDLRASINIGLSRYLLGKFFRVKNRTDKKKIIIERMNISQSISNNILYFFIFIPFSGIIFDWIYKNRFLIKRFL